MQACADAFARRSLPSRMIDLLFPPLCAVCGKATAFSPYFRLCETCLPTIHWLSAQTSCRHCGMPVGPHLERVDSCPECDSASRYTRACAAVRWGHSVAKLVHAYKFQHEFALAESLGQAMATRVRMEDFLDEVQAVVPVPLHPARRWERGFDQTALLARTLARALHRPMHAVLTRMVNTPPQSLLGGEERRRNLHGAFAATRPHAGLRACLLVDDVMTTGTTMNACAAVLRELGVERIYAVTFAR